MSESSILLGRLDDLLACPDRTRGTAVIIASIDELKTAVDVNNRIFDNVLRPYGMRQNAGKNEILALMRGKGAGEAMQRVYRHDHPRKVTAQGTIVKKAKYLGAQMCIEQTNRPEIQARKKAMRCNWTRMGRFWKAQARHVQAVPTA